jgi:hypothetical protein
VALPDADAAVGTVLAEVRSVIGQRGPFRLVFCHQLGLALQRCVHGVVRQVEEERPLFLHRRRDERDCLPRQPVVEMLARRPVLEMR